MVCVKGQVTIQHCVMHVLLSLQLKSSQKQRRVLSLLSMVQRLGAKGFSVCHFYCAILSVSFLGLVSFLLSMVHRLGGGAKGFSVCHSYCVILTVSFLLCYSYRVILRACVILTVNGT